MKKLLILIVLVSCFMFHVSSTVAQESQSGKFKLDSTQLTIDDNDSFYYDIRAVWSNLAKSQYEDKGYAVRVSPLSTSPITFTIKDTDVEFNQNYSELSQLGRTELKVDTAIPYEVVVRKIMPFQNLEGDEITDLSYNTHGLWKVLTDEAQTITSGTGDRAEASVTLKVNKKPNQTSGIYQGVIEMVAVPSY